MSTPQEITFERLQKNPRVSKIRIIVANDACPACRQQEGEYAKELVPTLPTPGCSHPLKCRCFYQPTLTEIFP